MELDFQLYKMKAEPIPEVQVKIEELDVGEEFISEVPNETSHDDEKDKFHSLDEDPLGFGEEQNYFEETFSSELTHKKSAYNKFLMHEQLLNQQQKNVHMNLIRKCDKYTYQPSNQKHFETRIHIHDKSKIFKCSKCDYKTKMKSYLHRHSLKHLESKLLNCQLCSYKTHLSWNLKKHMVVHVKHIHDKNKIFKCTKCDYRTKVKSYLQKHSLKHLESKLLNCQLCSYKTHLRWNLKKHMPVHVKPIAAKRRTKDLYPHTANMTLVTKPPEVHPPELHQSIKDEKISMDKINLSNFEITGAKLVPFNILVEEDIPVIERLAVSTNRISSDVPSSKEPLVSKSVENPSTLNIEAKTWSLGNRKSSQYKFSCGKCSFQTNTRYQLEKHRWKHLETKKLCCTKCRFNTRLKKDLEKHMLTHHKIVDDIPGIQEVFVPINEADNDIPGIQEVFVPINEADKDIPSIQEVLVATGDVFAPTSAQETFVSSQKVMTSKVAQSDTLLDNSNDSLHPGLSPNLVPRIRSLPTKAKSPYKCLKCNFQTRSLYQFKNHEWTHFDPLQPNALPAKPILQPDARPKTPTLQPDARPKNPTLPNVTARRGAIQRMPSLKPEVTFPEYPFQSLVCDYFNYRSRYYLVAVDRCSNWPIVEQTTCGVNGLIAALRRVFVQYGISDEVLTGGAPEFSSVKTAHCLRHCGVRHSASSYSPLRTRDEVGSSLRTRAEARVETVKRMITGNTDSCGKLDTNRLEQAVIRCRNTFNPGTRLSPALVAFGRPIRDFIPIQPADPASWEEALRNRHLVHGNHFSSSTRSLPSLFVGDYVRIQNQVGLHPCRWDKYGIVARVCHFDLYLVRVHKLGRATLHNRKFLRPYVPTTRKLPARKSIPSSNTPLSDS